MRCYICNKEGTLDTIKNDSINDTLFRCGVVHLDRKGVTIKHGCGKPVCGSCYCNCNKE